MKLNGKLKTLIVSLALLGIVIVMPFSTNADEEINQTLSRGMHKPDVKPLQQQLNELDYYRYHIDGIFGPLTFNAVENFQKDNGLSADGIAGSSTLKHLKKVKALEHTYKNAPLLNRGKRGKIVKTVQTQLQHLNYYHGKLDGIYGPLTERAVKDFQKTNHIAVDGVAGPVTFSTLIHNPIRNRERDGGTKKRSTIDESPPKTVSAKVNTKKNKNTKNVSRDSNQRNASTLYVESTAYTAHCSGCSGITATGINLLNNPESKVIAVDPDVVPLGSTVWVEGYGYAVAGDTGGAINGHKIDVFIPSRSKAMQWGRKTVKIKVFK